MWETPPTPLSGSSARAGITRVRGGAGTTSTQRYESMATTRGEVASTASTPPLEATLGAGEQEGESQFFSVRDVPPRSAMLERRASRAGSDTPIPGMVREAFEAAYDEVETLKDVDVTDKAGLEFLVKKLVGVVEAKVESAFLQTSDWLAEEISREQQHLVLMQNQLDKQSQGFKKEIDELTRRLEQEKTARTFGQRAAKESASLAKEVLKEQTQALADHVELLEVRLRHVEVPWWQRCFTSCIGRVRAGAREMKHYRPLE